MVVCYECQHCELFQSTPHYSTYTPGEDMELYCSKGYWRYTPRHDGLQNLATKLNTAQNCPDYTPANWINRA